MLPEQDLLNQFHQLSYYTLSHQGKDFIHQHVVDAITSQCATETTKPITLFFALAGLYLFLEKNYTGKQVQNAHVQKSNKTKNFPSFHLPAFRGGITVTDVLNCEPDIERDNQIKKWCAAVWNAYKDEREKVIAFTEGF